jgi:hypothetical protein
MMGKVSDLLAMRGIIQAAIDIDASGRSPTSPRNPATGRLGPAFARLTECALRRASPPSRD